MDRPMDGGYYNIPFAFLKKRGDNYWHPAFGPSLNFFKLKCFFLSLRVRVANGGRILQLGTAKRIIGIFSHFLILYLRNKSALAVLFDLILYVPSTIFRLYRDGSSWVEPVLS